NLLILKKPFDTIEVYQLAVALTEKWTLRHQANLKQADLEELVEARTCALKEATLRDPMTKLANRTMFNERLEESLRRTRRSRSKTVLSLIDIDFFKQINDSLGHPVGDRLLVEVSNRLQATLRDTDTVARLGGDEFAIIQSDIREDQEFRAVLRRVENSLNEPYEIEGRKLDCTFSIGITVSPDDGDRSEDLLKKADLALYRAKKDGRATTRFYEAEMDNELVKVQKLSTELRRAIATDEFEMFYQPIVNTFTGKIGSFEGLIRWNHPRRGLVSPARFIPVAEETGLIAKIGEWALKTGCENAIGWPEETKLSINVSPIQFRPRYELVRTFSKILDSLGFPPERLEIEITETALLVQSKDTMKQLHEFRDMGVSIVLDDFGVGHSSLNYIQSFPFDKLKLDRSFVASALTSDKSKAILRLVAGLGKNLNCMTTAEGVETEKELKLVQDEGFSQIQGFLVGKPAPAEFVSEFLEADWTSIFKSPTVNELTAK
ncbi:MAG: EAL domain-containing protein, partial [Planctomycetota bacterium]